MPWCRQKPSDGMRSLALQANWSQLLTAGSLAGHRGDSCLLVDSDVQTSSQAIHIIHWKKRINSELKWIISVREMTAYCEWWSPLFQCCHLELDESDHLVCEECSLRNLIVVACFISSAPTAEGSHEIGRRKGGEGKTKDDVWNGNIAKSVYWCNIDGCLNNCFCLVDFLNKNKLTGIAFFTWLE